MLREFVRKASRSLACKVLNKVLIISLRYSRSQEYLRFYLRRHLGKYFRMIVAVVHSQNFETPGLYGFWKVLEKRANFQNGCGKVLDFTWKNSKKP